MLLLVSMNESQDKARITSNTFKKGRISVKTELHQLQDYVSSHIVNTIVFFGRDM